MADVTQYSPESSRDSHHLMLLASPLDSAEAVEGLSQSNDNGSSTSGGSMHEISDEVVVSKHFGTSGRAVLVGAAQARAVADFANRHRAIYTMSMVLLSTEDFRNASLSAQGLTFPLWLFRPQEEQQRGSWGASAAAAAAAAIRPAQVTGFSIKHAKDGLHTLEKYCGASNVSTTGNVHARSTQGASGLRPAQDVMNRLRYDAAFVEADFRVVYEDRFDGEISLDLSQWASDVSEEDFVPQHRILRFERKWDDVVIWDRQRRLDLVFDADRTGTCTVSGFAVAVGSMEQLLQITGTLDLEAWATLKKTQLGFTDGDGGTVKGVAF